MSNSYIVVVLLALQSALTSGAAVRQRKLRAEYNVESKVVSLVENVWNKTVPRFIQHEIEMPRSAPQVDKTVYVAITMLLGFCGCDRCFMGQVCLGVGKGLTCGGFLIWFFIDYFVCIYVALSKAPKIEMMGYNAVFEPSTIDSAFWLCIALTVVDLLSKYIADLRVKQQYQLQQHQQQMVLEKLFAANQANTTAGVQTNAPSESESSLNIPRSHQTLAYIPTPLTRALRKMGYVSEKPALPEVIAAFAKLDKNKDGQLDLDEIQEAFAAMGTSDNDVRKIITTADKNGDGKISKDEFLLAYAMKDASPFPPPA